MFCGNAIVLFFMGFPHDELEPGSCCRTVEYKAKSFLTQCRCEDGDCIRGEKEPTRKRRHTAIKNPNDMEGVAETQRVTEPQCFRLW